MIFSLAPRLPVCVDCVIVRPFLSWWGFCTPVRSSWWRSAAAMTAMSLKPWTAALDADCPCAVTIFPQKYLHSLRRFSNAIFDDTGVYPAKVEANLDTLIPSPPWAVQLFQTLMRIPPSYQRRYGINLQSDHQPSSYQLQEVYLFPYWCPYFMVMMFHSVENQFWLYPIHRFTHYQIKNDHIVRKVTQPEPTKECWVIH